MTDPNMLCFEAENMPRSGPVRPKKCQLGLSDYWYAFQQELFPRLESELGPMGERYELFVAVLIARQSG